MTLRQAIITGTLMWVIALIIALIIVNVVRPAHAHEDMDGTNYNNWTNQQGSSCCNNQDCHTLKDEEVRDDGKTVEVFIEGKWCSVRTWHYTKTGNAQRADVNHVCVYQPDIHTDPCPRLLCFRPKTGF